MSPSRLQLIRNSYNKLNASGKGVTLDDIARHYAVPENHPDIVAGRVASPRDIYLRFMSLWDT